jgi:hypothetical protein
VIKKKTAKSPIKKKVLHKRNFPLVILIGVLLLVLFGFLGYSVLTFQNSEYEQQGFITCNNEKTKCEESKHIHADIDVSLCGEHIQFAKESGNTDKQHTHKERNKIHWHARIPIDSQSQRYIDDSPRRLKEFFKQLSVEIPTTCPNNPNPTMTMTVNDIEQSEQLNYVWQDGDFIKIIVQ